MVIKVLNLRECIGRFQDIKGISLAPEIKYATRIVQRTAKTLVPVDTGTLRNSIKTRYLPESESGVIYSALEYAPHVEFGTVFMREQPFLGPAFEIHREGINKRFKKYLQDQIRRKAK